MEGLFNLVVAQSPLIFLQSTFQVLCKAVERRSVTTVPNQPWTHRLSGSQLLAGVAWELICHPRRQILFNWYFITIQKYDSTNPQAKVDPFQPPHYSNNQPWLGIANCSDSASNRLSWYASHSESDGPRTSDLSPVSGYFDWSHSSNNTSPAQCDESMSQPSPNAASHPSAIAAPDTQLQFITAYPNLRRPSFADVSSTLNCQRQQNLFADYPEPERVVTSTEQDATTVLTSPKSPSLKHETWSQLNTKDVAEHEGSATSRSGKRWKAAHRAVERRYRSNLNLKIIKLGQCIPATREQAIAVEDLENGEDCRATAKAKLQKGHVLSQAVDYIQSLKQHVSELEVANRLLESRVQALHMLAEKVSKELPEIPDCQPPPEVRGLHYEEQMSSASADVAAEAEYFLPESRSQASPHTGFSFVSENPSLTQKRPKLIRGGVARKPLAS